jgi:hypothetical protein
MAIRPYRDIIFAHFPNPQEVLGQALDFFEEIAIESTLYQKFRSFLVTLTINRSIISASRNHNYSACVPSNGFSRCTSFTNFNIGSAN